MSEKMNVEISPLMLVSAAIMGTICAYLAYRRGKNPYLWFTLGALFGMFGIFAIFFFSKSQGKPAPKEPIFYLDGPSDKFWYYLDASRTSQGPMSKDALFEAFHNGTVDRSTYIWHEEMSGWKKLQEALKEERLES